MLYNIVSLINEKDFWLPDLRKKFNGSPDSCRCVIRLVTLTGEPLDFDCDLPCWSDTEQRDFVFRYLTANVYNILCGNSGRSISFFYDTKDLYFNSLIAELPGIFQLDSNSRCGFGKVVNIANRIGRMLGGSGFMFKSRDISEYTPVSTPTESAYADLAKALQKRIERSSNLNCVGIDIGGTDIKLAASIGEKLVCIKEFDWNPAESPTAQEIYYPILLLIRLMRACIAVSLIGADDETDRLLSDALHKDASIETMEHAVSTAEERLTFGINVLDAVGISFPDIVIHDRIIGGETPKTAGIRANTALDYEAEFARLTRLKDMVLELCREGGSCHITNDGNIAAFTAAMEAVAAGDTASVKEGIVAFAIGTGLGTGWVLPSGEIPQIPLEMYELLLNLGALSDAKYPPADIRSTRSENTGLPGISSYVGQPAAFRMAYKFDKSMLDGYLRENNGLINVQTEPEDLRKPCLEHLMRLAAAGKKEAEDIFRCTGYYLAQVTMEMDHIFRIGTRCRYLFGRFAKHKRCFELICEGFASARTDVSLKAADNELAATPLMRQLAASEAATVAQFGQAIGSIYFAV